MEITEPKPLLFLICLVLTFLILVLSNARLVRKQLGKTPGIAFPKLYLHAFYEHFVALGLPLWGCFIVGVLIDLGVVTSALIAGASTIGGFIVNLVPMTLTVKKAHRAVSKLPSAADSSLKEGTSKARWELVEKKPEPTVWDACLRQADFDQEIASTYYVLRRSRSLAREYMLASREAWRKWIPSGDYERAVKNLTSAWGD